MSQKNNKDYHLTCILIPDLDEGKRVKVIKQIKDKIQGLEGSVQKEYAQPEELEKRKLSYLMNKTREAYYWEADLSIPAKSLHQLQAELNLNKSLIRFLITTQEKAKPKTEKSDLTDKELDLDIIDKIEPATEPTEQPAETESKTEKEKPEKEKSKSSKNKIEDLDKKLDEILNE